VTASRRVAASDKLVKAYHLLKVPSFGLWSARALEKRGLLLEALARYLEAQLRDKFVTNNGCAGPAAEPPRPPVPDPPESPYLNPGGMSAPITPAARTAFPSVGACTSQTTLTRR
jgi:hypothetical protein